VPGEDFIVAELFKNSGQSLLEALHKITVSIWEKEVMAKEWNTGLTCPIFKKGDKLECKNYRGITLLNIAYKVLSCIILERINQHAESVLGEYQCGFRCGRSTVEQIFIIRQLMEKCFEFNTDLHICRL
jgi:sorting nexin-29